MIMLPLAQTSKAATIALLPLSADDVPKRNVRLLEEAFVTALSEMVDQGTLSPDDIDDSLTKKQRENLRACTAASCWVRSVGRLEATTLLHVSVMPDHDVLLLSFKLIDVAQKRIVKRQQKTIEKKPSTFSTSLPSLVGEFFGKTKADAPVVAPAATGDSSAINASAPLADLAPAEPPQPLPEVPPTAINNIGAYQWSDGIGFTHNLKSGSAAGSTSSGNSVALKVPELTEATLNEARFTVFAARTTLNPAYTEGNLFTTPAQMVDVELRHFYEWRAPYWFIAPWIDTRLTLGSAKILRDDLKAVMGSLGTRVGLDVHPLPWYQARPMVALGGFVGGRYYQNYWSDTAWNPETRDKDRGINIEYGASLHLRTHESPGAPALVSLTANYLRRNGATINGTYASADLAVTFSPVSINVFIERRLATSGTFAFTTPFGELMAPQMRIGGGIGYVW
jgi:hypothetical protein